MRVCMNADCELCDEEIEVHLEESRWLSPFCQSCHSKGRIIVRHRGQEFPCPEAFDEHAIGLVKEYRLLKRIIDGGIGTPEDQERYNSARQFLPGVTCSCCHLPLFKQEEEEV